MRWFLWSALAVSIALNVADVIYDGLPIAVMIVGACFR
jgi:hypothetical protein